MSPGTAVRITGDDVLGSRLAGMTGTVKAVVRDMVIVTLTCWPGRAIAFPVTSVAVREQEAAD